MKQLLWISSIIAAFAAIVSAYYAAKSYGNFRFSIMPLLIPENDTADPKILKLSIKNKGKGVAKNIKISIISIGVENEDQNIILLSGQEFIFSKNLEFD